MNDFYLSANDEETLAAICARYINVIGPSRGRAATAAAADNEGGVIEAQAAVGDPQKWYVCIRADEAPAQDGTFALCDQATGLALLGGWAM